MLIKGHVTNRRIVSDDPIDLPDGTALTLLKLDQSVKFGDAELSLLNQAFSQLLSDLADGRLEDTVAIFEVLRTR